MTQIARLEKDVVNHSHYMYMYFLMSHVLVIRGNLFQISPKAAAWDEHFFNLNGKAVKFNHANIYGNLSYERAYNPFQRNYSK